MGGQMKCDKQSINRSKRPGTRIAWIMAHVRISKSPHQDVRTYFDPCYCSKDPCRLSVCLRKLWWCIIQILYSVATRNLSLGKRDQPVVLVIRW